MRIVLSLFSLLILSNFAFALNYLDKACEDESLVYEHPILANAETTCHVNIIEDEVTLVEKHEAPKNHFSFVYFGRDDSYVYFVFNGKPFPGDDPGYIKVKRVSLSREQNFKSDILDVINTVPGYSGGVFHDIENKKLYVTLSDFDSSNYLFEMPSDKVWELMRDEKTGMFMAYFDRVAGPFSGLSFKLFVSDRYFLYENPSDYAENYLSYVLDRKNGFEQKNIVLPKGCQVLELENHKWNLLNLKCTDEQSVKSFKIVELYELFEADTEL